MYNIYKYQEEVRAQQAVRSQDENYTKWLIRREEIKAQAVEKVKEKVEDFLLQESVNPSRVEDDHYKTWRYNKQFRDVEDSNRFKGFKAFRHRPNYDMDKYFTERERKEISYIADKSIELVRQNKIPHELRSRSLRSQGPLNPKHTFRDRKKDHEYIQPRMRYTNITDKERFAEASMTYDDKFSKLYQSFYDNKSKIGKSKVSPAKNGAAAAPAVDMMESTYSDVGKNEKFYYESPMNEEQQLCESIVIEQRSPSKDSGKKKTYFKTGKTLALKGDKLAKEVMVASQYDRQKDLTNLKYNMENESFVKRPIL